MEGDVFVSCYLVGYPQSVVVPAHRIAIKLVHGVALRAHIVSNSILVDGIAMRFVC